MTFSPEVQEILDRVRTGTPKPKRQRSPKAGGVGVLSPAQKRAASTPNSTSFKRVYNYPLMVSLYSDLKMDILDIADYIGCSRATVAAALDEAGIDPEERKAKILQPQEYCKRKLHLMKDCSIVLKSGARTCDPCRKTVTKIARLRRDGKPLTPELLEFLEAS